MHFEGRRRVSQGPNLTPLIDVVFLLLVFFMLTSHFVREEAIPLDLPTATSGATLAGDNLQVILDAQGLIRLQGQVVAADDLEIELRQELPRHTDQRLWLRGDRGASLGLTVKILDAARRAGAAGVEIVTRER